MKIKRTIKSLSICFILILFFLIIPKGHATEELAEKAGKDCGFCHLDPSGGVELTRAGKTYLPKGEASKTHKFIRLIAGYLHLVTAIFWFGTILYVHIILKPSYASLGLPRDEVRLGLVSMAIMAVSGTILSLYRVPSLSFLIETRFGILLLIKITLFLIMVGTALLAVFLIGPKLALKKQEKQSDPQKGLTIENLASLNGTEGRTAYIAYKGKLYEVSHSQFWENGKHFGRHSAGTDLTEMLNQAPHGEEKIFEMPQVGSLTTSKTKRDIPPQLKVFYFAAYLNLCLVWLIVLILAIWRWW